MTDSNRDMRLLDGRRVQVRDLLDAELLAVGAELEFTRSRMNETYRASVTEVGRLRLADGREFASPSRAAKEAADLPAVDGWHAWSVLESGEPLSALRHQLLQRTLAPLDGDKSPEPNEVEQRQDELVSFREAAEAGMPRSLMVRELIGLWGAKGRGQNVLDRICADLDNHSLETRPDFRKVSLDANVALIAQPTPSDEVEPADLGDSQRSSQSSKASELDVGLTLGNLPSALAGVIAINPNDTIAKAMTLMRLNDFSQLPVMTTTRDIKGAVTWRSIAKALAHSSSASLADAIEAAADHEFDQDLVDVLATLYEHDFLFVRDSKREISGIVTTADVVRLYGETATPFFIIGEIDHLLRGVVSEAWTVEQVVGVCDPDGARSIDSHDDLTIGDYQRMLENNDRFVSLGWPLDRSTFINRLDEVREIRNGVAHFDPDPLDESSVAALRNFLKLLRDLRKWDVS